MSSPTRNPASKSILLVWILNVFLLGIGNVYASGLSALRWLAVGLCVLFFVHHAGAVVATYVLLSLIGTGEIIAVSGLTKATPKLKEPKYGRRREAINAPTESRLSNVRVRHVQPPENLAELTDEFVRQHLKQDNEPVATEVTASNAGLSDYGDLHAGQLTYDALASAAQPYAFNSPAIESLSMPELISLDYQSLGTQPLPECEYSACPHCGANTQNDFSFCLGCGHAYAIG